MDAATLLKLKERHSILLQKRAGLLALEDKKRQERELLEKELTSLGIDPTKPEEERERLETELEKFMKDTETTLNQFEEQLKVLQVTP